METVARTFSVVPDESAELLRQRRLLVWRWQCRLGSCRGALRHHVLSTRRGCRRRRGHGRCRCLHRRRRARRSGPLGAAGRPLGLARLGPAWRATGRALGASLLAAGRGRGCRRRAGRLGGAGRCARRRWRLLRRGGQNRRRHARAAAFARPRVWRRLGGGSRARLVDHRRCRVGLWRQRRLRRRGCRRL